MKVLVIGSRVPFPLHDGGAIATFNLLKGLSESGVSVDFLAINTSKHFVDSVTLHKEFSFLNAVDTYYINTDIKVHKAFLNLFQSSSYNVDRFTQTGFAKLIQSYLDKNAYDIIHFEGLFVAQYRAMIKTKVKTILRQHNVEYKIWQTLANTKSGLKKRYIQLLADRMGKFEKRVVHEFDAVVSITEADKLQTQNDLGYSGKIVSIPAGLISKTSQETTTNSQYIYHIGSMEWMPNLEAMQWFHNDIWPLIEQQNKGAEFFMAGKNMPSHFMQWNTQKFHVVGEVKNLKQFSADKSILAVPLRSGSGIRIKTIEAMMSGKAVVTTTQGALGLDIRDGEHCLIADDPQKFAEHCIHLVEDNTLRNEIAERGKKFAEQHFGNQAVSEMWMKFYGNVIG